MARRAVIYIRTSSETQGEKSSQFRAWAAQMELDGMKERMEVIV